MHVPFLKRRIHVALAVLSVAAVLAVDFGGSAAVAAVGSMPIHVAGTWSGRYNGAFSGTFTLHWKDSGSKLNGSITLSNPRGRYGINGSVRGGSIKFGVVGAGATYAGAVSGNSMSGTYQSPQGGGTWSAHKRS